MKILHILDHSIPLHSGYTFRTRNILAQQRLLGWETAHLTSSKHGAAMSLEEEVDGFRFYRTLTKSGLLSRLPVLNQVEVINALTARLDQVFDKERPDILHAHSPSLNGLAALRVGRRHGVPVVYECRAFWEDAAVDHGTSTEQGMRYRMTRMLETRVFQKANAVTTICEGLKRDIISRGVLEDKVTVIPNAVDIDQFSMDVRRDESLRKELRTEHKKVLGFIGSFYAYEGLPLLLEALLRINESASDVSVLLIGGGPQASLLRRCVKELGLQDQVIFTGRVPHREVQRYYNLVDIFVYPRLSMRLTELVTPLKPLEAMAKGRLVVASDVGGHKELIDNGVNGHLFRAGDVVSLAETVCYLLNHQEKWSALRKAGRRFVEKERNWAASVDRYRAVYGRLGGCRT